MGSTLTPELVEATAKANGLSVAMLCSRAGVAHSTFTRWRKGETEPTLDVYRRLVTAASSKIEQAA